MTSLTTHDIIIHTRVTVSVVVKTAQYLGDINVNIEDCEMPGITVYENEHFDRALRRFKKTVEESGLLNELRRREFYEKPTAVRKRAKASAKKRWERVMEAEKGAVRMY